METSIWIFPQKKKKECGGTVWNNFNRPVYLLPAVCYVEKRKCIQGWEQPQYSNMLLKQGMYIGQESFHGVGKAGKDDLEDRNN